MTSRKDYIEIAAAFALFRMPKADENVENMRADLARTIADYFQMDNPRFDRRRFLLACGVQP